MACGGNVVRVLSLPTLTEFGFQDFPDPPLSLHPRALLAALCSSSLCKQGLC